MSKFFEEIVIGSKLDAKGFKQADTALGKLSRSAKTLGRSLGLAFGTAALVNFGKASVKAFVADDNAARSLGITLKNLGLETGNTSIYVNDLISRLEKQTGVLDDQLRPAMDKLLRATGSVSKATTLLNLALDISAGTGKDLTTVSQGLQKAYLGNNASLGRLGVGLTKAELTSSSFEEIQIRLTKLFAGQASSAAESYAGSMAKLAVASNNVKEIIGKGIVDSLVVLSEDNTVSNLASDMENLATYTADVIRGFGLMASELKKIPGISGFDVGMIPILGTYIKVLQDAGSQSRRAAEVAKGKNPIQSGSYLNKPAKTKPTAAEIAAAAAAAKLLKTQQAQLKATKNQLILAKAAAIFDIKRIQIAAALKGQISAEERIRLELMMAIEDDNAAKADELTKKLAAAQANTEKLAGTISTLPNANDPFGNFNNAVLGAKTRMQELRDLVGTPLPAGFNLFPMPSQSNNAFGPGISNNPYVATSPTTGFGGTLNGLVPGVSVPSNMVSVGGGAPSFPISNIGGGNTTVNVTFAGVVTDPIAVANQLNQVLAQSANSVGTTTGLGSGYKNVTYIV